MSYGSPKVIRLGAVRGKTPLDLALQRENWDVVRALRPAPWLFQVADKAEFTGLICWRLGRVDKIAWQLLKVHEELLSTQLSVI